MTSKQEIISKLKEVKVLNSKIRHIETRIEAWRSRTEFPGMVYSDLPKLKANYRESVYAKYVERLEILQCEKSMLESEIDIIMEDFFGLDDVQYRLLCLRYIEDLPWLEVAKKLGYCVKQCQRLEQKTFDFLNVANMS